MRSAAQKIYWLIPTGTFVLGEAAVTECRALSISKSIRKRWGRL
jgi:hypothetical protein